MNSNAILSSDVLDILFDNRNKNYGAYTLRKFYPDRVKTSLLIMLGLAAVFSAFTLIPKGHKPGDGPIITNGILIASPVDLAKEPEKPKEQPPQQRAHTPTQQFNDNFQVVKDNQASTPLNDITDLAIGNVTDTTGLSAGPADLPISEGPSTTYTEPAPPAEPDINIPLENPDVPPTFPGGTEALRRFLERHLQAPEDISEAVQVKVKFVVDNEGNLESFAIVQDGGEDFNKEVIRVLKKMPQWNPGKNGGRNIKAYCYLPVKFAPLD